MKNRRLRRVELEVLRATAEALPERARRILETQVAEVNLVQRHAGGREVNLYRRRLWFWPASFSVCFPNKSEELPLARVELASGGGSVTATVWAVRGDVFTLALSEGFTATSSGPVVAGGVSLLEDPLRDSENRRSAGQPDIAAISAVLGLPKERIRGARPPLGHRHRRRRLELLGCDPPADWLRLTRVADGFRVGPATVHGLVGLPSVAFSQGTYHVLAEGISDALLCLRCQRGEARLVAIDHEGSLLEEYESGFSEALRAYLASSPVAEP